MDELEHELRVGDVIGWGEQSEHRGHVTAVRDDGTVDVVPGALAVQVDPATLTVVVRREDRDDYR